MERYQNIGGNSGVSAYAIGSDFIKVQFKDGSIYLYDYSSQNGVTGSDALPWITL